MVNIIYFKVLIIFLKGKNDVPSSPSIIEISSSDPFESRNHISNVSFRKPTPKKLRPPEDYSFLEVPIIVPSTEELSDPFLLIKRVTDEGY